MNHSGEAGGTIRGAPKHNEWDSQFYDTQIRDNWRSLVSSCQVASRGNTNLDSGGTLTAALRVFGAVVTVVSLTEYGSS